MTKQLEKDLQKALEMIGEFGWDKQTDDWDRKTNFIYQAESLEDCLQKAQLVPEVPQSYVLHRWYNFHTSVVCEYLFCEFGAVHEVNKYNHDIDIYINGIPYDVKLTVYPAALEEKRPYDLWTRNGKDAMIQWLYHSQTKGNRNQFVNRLYVLCDAKTPEERLAMKSEFDLQREAIRIFMRDARKRGLNGQNVLDERDGSVHHLHCDLIYVVRGANGKLAVEVF